MPFRAMYVGWQPESKMAKICPIKNHRVLNFRRGIYLTRVAFRAEFTLWFMQLRATCPVHTQVLNSNELLQDLETWLILAANQFKCRWLFSRCRCHCCCRCQLRRRLQLSFCFILFCSVFLLLLHNPFSSNTFRIFGLANSPNAISLLTEFFKRTQ